MDRRQSTGPASLYTYGASCAGDFDDDGWPDLYVASLRQSRSYLFRNDGNGGFTPVTNLVTQTSAPAFQAAWGDYDNDGRLDLFVACWTGTSALYRNLGNGEFERPATAPTFTGTHNFVSWVDYDNDGFLDLWVSGYMSGNKLFRNNGDGSFTGITTGSLVNERPLNNAGTYQVAWFDYDNDGFLDAYVMNGDDNTSIWTANQLFRNNGNDNAWLTVKPIGTVSNRDAAGAKVQALATYAGRDRWQRRDITVGCLSDGNHRYAHFGLGDAQLVTRLRIEWPSGVVEEFANLTPEPVLHHRRTLAARCAQAQRRVRVARLGQHQPHLYPRALARPRDLDDVHHRPRPGRNPGHRQRPRRPRPEPPVLPDEMSL
ncbi:MAG: CRTAC1 family protein [Verrucomicrobia bacterium]|nr:CRTAC1 family protein [Verrucomicrobiota bacterium]